MKKVITTVFLLISTLISITSFASGTVSFRTVQARVKLPIITTWVDVTDENGQTINDLKSEQLLATVGSHSAKVKHIKLFSELDKGTAFIFLVDISKSLTPELFAQIQVALNTWVNGMHEKDKVALISFGSQVKLLQDFSADKELLKQKIDILSLSDMNTFFYQGLMRAFELGRRQDHGLPSRRVIVVLTDGIDDAAGGVTKDEVFLHMSENRIPIYAIGFAMPPKTQNKENGLKALGVLSRTSGGHFIKANSKPLTEAYALQKERIENSYELELSCDDCIGEGQLSRLNITLTAGDRMLSDGLDLRLLPGTKTIESNKQLPPEITKDENKEITEESNYVLWVSIAAAVVLIILLVFLLKKRKVLASENILKEAVDDVVKENGIGNAGEASIATKYNFLFTVVTGLEPGKQLKLGFNKSAVIGRSPDCDLCIDDSEVSSIHAEIEFNNGVLAINDLNSKNGTLINGVPIHTVHYLQDNDQIIIGRTELRLNGLDDDLAS